MNNTDQRKLCVGIPSVAREGVTYLRTAVGSLLGGLTTEERNNIYLMVFLPHSDPTIHPAYKENWLYDLADQVLLYDLPEDKMKHIAALERDAGLFREKGLFDYTYLLKACHSRQTPYVAMFEDDIVAMDGWYHRTITGLDKAQTESVLKKASWDCEYTPSLLTVTIIDIISPLSSSFLHRGVSRLEQRILASLSVLVTDSRRNASCGSVLSSARLCIKERVDQA